MKISKLFNVVVILFSIFSTFLNASITIHPNAEIDLSGNSQMAISGDWLNNGILNTNGCKVVFFGTTDSYITNSSGENFDLLDINKTGANVILNNDITIFENLNFISGNLLTTSSNEVIFSTNGTISGETSSTYLIGFLNTNRNIGTGSSDFGGIGVSLTSGADNLGNVTITRKSGAPSSSIINGIEGIDRKWYIYSSSSPTNGRDLTLSWVSPDDNSSNLNYSKTWQSNDGTSNWQAFGEVTNTSGTRSITVPVTELNYFTVSSTSTINLPDNFVFDEGGSLEVDFEDYISNLNSKNIKSNKKKNTSSNSKSNSKKMNFAEVSHEIVKNRSGKTKSITMNIPNTSGPTRSTSVSITGLDDVTASVNGMIVEFSAEENWNGTDDIVVSVIENSKFKTIKDTKLSYYDDVQIIVNTVNDAPYIISKFPLNNFETRQDSLTSMSVEVADIDNTFEELSFIWEIDNIDQENNDSLFSHIFLVMGTYEVKAFVSDGAISDSTTWSIIVLGPSGIHDDENLSNLPTVTKIYQNYPNPFNPTTKIDYQLHETSPVTITVYNQKGETIRRLLDKSNLEAGRYSISWDGKSDHGSTVSAGLYFYSIKTNSYQNVKKAIMVK